jgi:hypothetical protein
VGGCDAVEGDGARIGAGGCNHFRRAPCRAVRAIIRTGARGICHRYAGKMETRVIRDSERKQNDNRQRDCDLHYRVAACVRDEAANRPLNSRPAKPVIVCSLHQ